MEQRSYKNKIKRVAVYCLGLLFMGIGVSFSVKSNLGVSPVNSLPYVVSLITGIEQGTCVVVVFGCYIILQALILGRNFRWTNLLQIIAATIFGYFVTFSNKITAGIVVPNTYGMQLAYLLISMAIVAVGVDLYLKSEVVSLPTEGVMEALVQRFYISFPNAKTGFDTTVVIVSTLLSLLLLEGLYGVREGTIIAAIGIGQLIKVWRKVTGNRVTEFLEG